MHSISHRMATPGSTLSKRLLTAGASALLLAACANFKGIESTAHATLPGDYATAESLPSQGGQWPDQNWAGSIGGAPLQALVDEALAGNPGLRIAAARVHSARAMAEGARAASLPIVGASFNETDQRFSEFSIYPPPFAGKFYFDNELALNFSYDFDFWGKHSADLRAAVSADKAAQAEQYSARLMLATAIVRCWIQMERQYEQLALVEQQQTVRNKIDRLTKLRLDAGLDTQTDRQQTLLQTALLRSERAQWQEAVALTRNQLAALMGQGPDRGQRIARAGLTFDAAVKLQAGLPNALPLALLGRRPDIVAARWRVEAAQGSIEGAKAQFYPNVNLAAFVGASSLSVDALKYLTRQGSRVAGIGPAITMPVFEGGRLRAQLKGQVAAYDGAVASYNQTLTEALRDVADQVQSLRAAETQVENQHNATQAAAATLRLAQQREQVGTVSMLQVLTTESAWLMQRKLELDAQARRTDLKVALIKALGGGFDAASQGLEPVAAPVPTRSEPSSAPANPSNPPLAKSAS
ncbi:MAG: efflux transporter outer membrane subunit [Burkholderiales bacterium]